MIGSLQQFLVALGGAIGIFLVGKLLIAGGHRGFEPALAWVRPTLVRIDQVLATSMCRWLGLDETGAWRRWTRLLGVLLALGLVGAMAPWPLGVAALLLGLLAVLAVFRRWAWDEEDRELGLPAEDRRFQGGEDYGDEALAALAAVVMFSSLLVWRLTGAQAFEGPSTEGAPGYLLHILSEVLAALPIVGNVDLLGYEDPSGVRVVQPNGGPVAFALRMAIDLVVIGGLLKAVDISRRIARGQDLRREEETLATRDLAGVLASVTRLRRLAQGGDANAMHLLSTAVADPAAGQAPRARLCAIHALRGVAAQHPDWASVILLDNTLACDALLQDPATAEAGLLGATLVEHAENLLAQATLSQSHVARTLINRAILALHDAVMAQGLTPKADAFLLDQPEPTSQLARAGLVLQLAKLKLNLTDISHEDSVLEILQEALGHTQLVLTHTPTDAPNEMRFHAHQYQGEILVRLGELDIGYEGSVMLTDALDAFTSAEGLLDESNPLQRIKLLMGRGVVNEILGRRTEGAPALAHFTEAVRLFDAATRRMVEAGFPISETAQGYLNQGNACQAAARACDQLEQALPWLQNAQEAHTAALRTVNESHWPALTLNAYRGLAATHEYRFQLTNVRRDIEVALGAWQAALDEIDPKQTPVDWAVAAMELSQAVQKALNFGGGALMSRAGLDRLRQARDLLVAAGATEEVQRCDELMAVFNAWLASHEGG